MPWPAYLDPAAVRSDPRVLSVTEVTSGANAAAVVTLAAVAGYRHYIPLILWSYSGTPTGGRITVSGLVGDDIDIDITAGGPGPIAMPPMAGSVGTAIVVTLAAGGGAVVGKLNVLSVPLRATESLDGLKLT